MRWRTEKDGGLGSTVRAGSRQLDVRPGTVRSRSSTHPASRVVTAWAFWLIFAANAAFIVALWAHGGNISGVHTAGQLLSSLGRITGLLGAYLLLVQVLLLARLPFLEQLLGFDRLTIWHRRNGKLCLYMILAHVVFISLSLRGAGWPIASHHGEELR